MKLSKRGPFYWVDFRSPAGKRHRLSTGETEEGAAYAKAGSIVQTAMAEPVAAQADSRLSLSDALESTYGSHWSRMRSAKVMRRMVDLLKRELVGVKVADTNTKTLRAHCERWLIAGTAPATVNRRISAVGVALTRCAEDGDIAFRPKMPHYKENNTKERYVTVEEEGGIFAYLAQRVAVEAITGGNDWEYMLNLAVFLLDTGFRYSEAFKFTLDGDHADLPHGTTKTGKGRRVPLTRRALAAAEYLLVSDRHKALQAMTDKQSWDWCSYRWDVATRAAGCPDVTLHILRHTTASRLVQRGIPIFTVSKWLGHSSVKITERYAKLAPDTMSMALSALEANPNTCSPGGNGP
jgi:integrase